MAFFLAGGGRLHALLALVVWPLTTHRFQDGACFFGWGVRPFFTCQPSRKMRVELLMSRDVFVLGKGKYRPSSELPALGIDFSVEDVGEGVASESRLRAEFSSFMHCRSRMTIGPHVPTLPGRSSSRFHRPGRHRVCTKRGAPLGVRRAA